MADLTKLDADATFNLMGGKSADSGMGLSSPGLQLPGNMRAIQPSNDTVAAIRGNTQRMIQGAMAQQAQQPVAQMFGYNRGTDEVATAAGIFKLSNLTEADAAIRAGALNKPLTQMPAGFEPTEASEIQGAIQYRSQNRGLWDAAKEVGRSAVAGVAGGIPEMVGKTIQFASPDQGFGHDYGQGLRDFGEFNTKALGGVADTYGRGEVASALVEGASNLGPSALGMAGAMVAPELALPAIVVMFGGAQAQDTYEAAIKKGIDKSTAMEAALKTGGIEGAGEAVADLLGGKLLSGSRILLRSLVGAGKISAEEAVRIATDPKVLRNFGKSMIGAYATESATEFAQGAGEAAVEKDYGIRPDADPMAEGIHGAKVAAGMTTLLAPFGLRSNYKAAQTRRALGEAIENKDRPTDLLEASRIVQQQIEPMVGKDQADDWMRGQFNTANDAYLGKLSAGYSDQARTGFMEGVEAAQPAPNADEVGPVQTPIDSLLWNRRQEMANQSAVQQATVPGVPVQDTIAQATGTDRDKTKNGFSAKSGFHVADPYNNQQERELTLGEKALLDAGHQEDFLALWKAEGEKRAKAEAAWLAKHTGATNASQSNPAPTGDNVQSVPVVGQSGDQGNAVNQVQSEQGTGQQAPQAEVSPLEAAFKSKRAEELWQAALAAKAADQISQAALEDINAVLTSGKIAAATTALDEAKQEHVRELNEATLTPEQKGLRAKLQRLSKRDRAIVNDVLGLDDEGNATKEPMTYEEVGKRHAVGRGKNKGAAMSKQSIQTILKKVGITDDVATRTQATDFNQTGLNSDDEILADLMPGGDAAESGIAVVGSTGSHVNEAPRADMNDEERRIAKRNVADTALADAWMSGTAITAQSAPSQAQVEWKATKAAENRKFEASAAAQKIARRRDAEATFEAAILAREEALAMAEDNADELLSRLGKGYDVETVGMAADEWDSFVHLLKLQSGGEAAEFSGLTSDQMVQVVRLFATEFSERGSGWADRLYNDFEEYVLNGNERERDNQRGADAAEGLAGEVPSDVPPVVSSEVQQDHGSDQREASGPAEEEIASGTSPAGGEAESDQAESGDAEEVTAEAIIAQWNDAARARGVAYWDGLSEEQRNYILGSGTWDEVNEAAQEVLDEINNVEGPAFSESVHRSKGADRNAIIKTLKALFFSPEKFGSLVTVVQSTHELTGTARQDLSESANSDNVQAFVGTDGKVYLIADNIQQGKELAVFLHEVGVHLGMEKLIGAPNMAKLTAQLRKWAASDSKSIEAQLARAAIVRADKSSSENMDEEVLAYFVELAVNSGITPQAVQKMNSPLAQWFRTLWAAAKVALRKLGLGRFDQLTAQNLVDLTYGAAKMELTGTWHGTAADFRNFNHDYMGSGEGAQAFGWGTYLAQRVGIAKGYWKDDVRRKGLHKTTTVNGKPISDRLKELVAKNVAFIDATNDYNGDPSVKAELKALQAIQRNMLDSNSTDAAVYFAKSDLADREDSDALVWLEQNEALIGNSGSLMRVDTAVHEDDLLDWDKPLSEQSEKVLAILRENRLLELKNVGPNVSGERLYRAVALDKFGGGTDSWANLTEGSDKAASEYLDSIGIKGIKFLDSQSRGPSASGAATTLNDVGLSHLAGPVDHYGKEKTIPTNAKLRTRGNTIYVQVDNGLLPDFVAIDTLSRDGAELLDDQGKLDALFAIKKFVPNQTRNLVIFDDKNIQRVASQVGADRNRVKFSEASIIQQNVDKLPQGLQDAALKLAVNLNDMAKKAVYATALGHDLADLVEKYLPSAKEYFDLSGRRGAEVKDLESNIDDILDRADKVKDRDAMMSFIRDSTRKQKWGYDLVDGSGKADPEFKKRFDALTPEARESVKEIFAHGHKVIKQLNALVKSELSEGYDTTGMDAKEIAQQEKKRMRALKLFDKTFKALSGPYAPLVRTGNYIMAAKSQAYIDAVANDDTKLVEQLAMDPDHYVVSFYESLGAATVAARKAAAEGKFAKGDNAPKAFAKEHFYNKSQETPWGALKRVRQMLESNDDSPQSKAERKAARSMRNMLNDLYFSALAEGSARQFQNGRRSIHGENEDMLRAFAIKGRADAHFMTSLKYSNKMMDALATARKAAMRNDDNRANRVRALNEVLARHEASMDYRPAPVQSFFQGVTSFWMLATNPAYYLQNATQPFMMTLPWLAGKYGYTKGWNAFFGAYSAITKGKLDIDKMPITDDERAMLHELKTRGVLDIGFDTDIGYWANTDRSELNLAVKTQHFFSKQIQRLEMINRVSSALAAYRLSNGNAEVAAECIRVTHGDYSKFNEPRIFSMVPGGRVILQFRKFQIIQLSMFARLIKQAWNGSSTDAVAARKSLSILLGHFAVMAGGLGLPAMNVMGWLIAAALGGEGDPKDEEYLLRKAIGNKDMADLLLRGVPAFLGVNMSQRLGAQNITSLTPFASKDVTTKDGFQERVMASLGASVGLGSRIADGLGLVLKGDTYKGMEQMLPSGVSNAMKGYRFATEGVTQRNHDIVMTADEVGFANALFQAMGLPTMKLTERQRNASLIFSMDKGFKDTAKQLKQDYADAVRGDGDAPKVLAQWGVLQEAERRNGFTPSPLSELFKAPSEQAKRERNVVDGIEFKRNNRDAVSTIGKL